MDDENNSIEMKSWSEFRSTGLLWFMNQILHMFGWAIVVNIDTDEEGQKIITDVHPARVKFRGFGEDSQARGYYKVSKFLKENIDDIFNEASDISDDIKDE